MTTGDRGVTLIINAGGYDMTENTVNLLAAPGRLILGNGVTLGPLTVAANGLTATYETTGTDFIQGGPWELQLVVEPPDGNLFTSAPGSIYVFPRL